MSRFTDVLLVSPLADGRTWVIMRDFGYDVGTEASGDRIDVAVGFQTQFPTIPRPLRILLAARGRLGRPGAWGGRSEAWVGARPPPPGARGGRRAGPARRPE